MDSSDNVATYGRGFRPYQGNSAFTRPPPNMRIPSTWTRMRGMGRGPRPLIPAWTQTNPEIVADAIESEAGLHGWVSIANLARIAAGAAGLAGATIRSAFDTPPQSELTVDYTTPVDSGSLINSPDSMNISPMPVPSQKTTRVTGVEIVTTPGKRTKVRSTPKSAQKSIAAQTISTAQTYYDSHLVSPGSNEKRLTRLSVKLGKQLYPDVITPFLENLCGKGLIRMQFAGRCLSLPGSRHNHLQMFRHRLSNGNGYNEQDDDSHNWPSTFYDYILGPANTATFYPSGKSTTGAGFIAGTTCWRDIVPDTTYWAPYNLADLEDCSWNLNSLKLGPQHTYQQTPDPVLPKFENQVKTGLTGNHYRQSYLAWNNSQGSVAEHSAFYRYKAVINKGSICYDFMNKGAGGAKIEVVIYRVKKNSLITWKPGGASTMNFANLAITNPISAGYLVTCKEKVGTDAVGGRAPDAADVVTNAQFPFLPKLKRTLQSDATWTEVTRQTFGMPSGSRREMNFDLPGLVYDPKNQPNINQASEPYHYPSVFDEHTYAAMISVCGVVCTDEMDTNIGPADLIGYNVGDMIGPSDVQFYCTYSESIGPCMYHPSTKAIMFSLGTITDNAVGATGIKEVPITILDQGSAVRLPQVTTTAAATSTEVHHHGYNMSNDVEASV